MFGNLSGPTLLVILFIVLLLFGAPKLPALARSLGQSMKILKKEVTSDEDTTVAQGQAPAGPQAPAASSAPPVAPQVPAGPPAPSPETSAPAASPEVPQPGDAQPDKPTA